MLEQLKEKYQDELVIICLGGFLSAIGLVTALLASGKPNPKIEGQEPVVRIESPCMTSFGYDFDKDGTLDYAMLLATTGRASGSFKVYKGTLEFKALQQAYQLDAERTR